MSPDLLQLAEAAHRRGDLAEAERLYRQLLAANARDASALYGLGTLALQGDQAQAAAGLLAQAAAIEPDAADIGLQLALALHRCGRGLEAAERALHCARLARGDEHFANALGRLLLDLGKPQAALELLRSCTATRPGTVILCARARGALGDWDHAVSLLRQLANDHSRDAEIARELSVAAGKLRDYPLAIASYERYLSLVEPRAIDYLRFADLYLMARDIDNSGRLLQLARQAGADGADYHVLRARLDRLRGDDAGARDGSIAALERQPGQGQAWAIRMETATDAELGSLGDELSRQLELDDSTPYYRTLMYYALADARDREGDLAAAAAALRQANSLQLRTLEQSRRVYDAAFETARMRRLREEFSLPLQPRAGAGGARPVFVLGMPRSGTTLVEKVLSRLEGVTAGGENEALGFVAAGYQRDVNAGLLPPPAALSAGQWQSLAERYAALTPGFDGVFIDKMPHNFLHVGLVLGMFPDARIIQLRRDPRDTCLSIYQRPFPEGHTYACDPQALAHAWREARDLMDHWAQLDPDRVMDLQFEEFVAHPRELSRTLAQFCDLQWRPECLDAGVGDAPSFTFSERQVRRSISSATVGRWHRYEAVLPELFEALLQQGCTDPD